MRAATQRLWVEQDRHTGDRQRLFTAVSGAIEAERVLYPGSFVDIAPSFVWPSVTYVDMDRRAARFFDDVDGVAELIADHGGPSDPHVRFVAADYSEPLPLDDEGFDLVVSLYTGPALDHVTRYLAPGGHVLANTSHGDVALAALDDRYELVAAIAATSAGYRARTDALDRYLVPKRSSPVTSDEIRSTGRGVGYTKQAAAYLFRRVP